MLSYSVETSIIKATPSITPSDHNTRTHAYCMVHLANKFVYTQGEREDDNVGSSARNTTHATPEQTWNRSLYASLLPHCMLWKIFVFCFCYYTVSLCLQVRTFVQCLGNSKSGSCRRHLPESLFSVFVHKDAVLEVHATTADTRNTHMKENKMPTLLWTDIPDPVCLCTKWKFL